MRPLVVFFVLSSVFLACDSQTVEDEPGQDASSLELGVDVVGSSAPVRDTLHVRVTGLNTTERLYLRGVRLNGEEVAYERSRVDDRTVDFAVYVSERGGTLRLAVEAEDEIVGDLGSETVIYPREARIELDVEVERTLYRRLVTGTSAYESDVSDVFHDTEGTLWVRLDGYRSSFWSSQDGDSFQRRRSGFERFLGFEDDTAWIEHTGDFNSKYLVQVDLATGETVAEHRVYLDAGLYTGTSHDGEFFGIHGGRHGIMHIGDEYVELIFDGPYQDPPSAGTLLDYHITPDGVHWLATTGRGVMRNAGAGWEDTAGLASETAIALAEGPGASIWSMAVTGDRCVVAEWEGSAWAERAAFEKDENNSCGEFAVGPTGGVWRGDTYSWIVRSKDGVIDRRYRSEAVTTMLTLGRTIWVGTGYGLREILDYEAGP